MKTKLNSTRNFKPWAAAVLNRRDGSSQSVTVCMVTPTQVKVMWKTSATSFASVWVYNDELDTLTLFPVGCKFLAV